MPKAVFQEFLGQNTGDYQEFLGQNTGDYQSLLTSDQLQEQTQFSAMDRSQEI